MKKQLVGRNLQLVIRYLEVHGKTWSNTKITKKLGPLFYKILSKKTN